MGSRAHLLEVHSMINGLLTRRQVGGGQRMGNLQNNTFLNAIKLLLFLGCWASVAMAGPQQDFIARLPEDSVVKPMILSKCTVCHTAERIVNSKRTKGEWTELLDSMIDYGAEVNDQQKEVILEYLSKNFPKEGATPAPSGGTDGSVPSSTPVPAAEAKPDVPNTAEGWIAKLPEGTAREMIQKKCTVCHTAERIVISKRTNGQWTDLVGRMIDYGADVNDAERAMILEYLSKNFPAAGSPAPAN